MSVLPTCMCVHHVYAWLPMEARRRHWFLWNWSYRCSRAAEWVLVIKCGSPARTAVLLSLSRLSSAPAS